MLPGGSDNHLVDNTAASKSRAEPHRRRPKLRHLSSSKYPSDTTIPPDVLDPKAPVPTVPIAGTVVYGCDRPPAGVVITGKNGPTPTTTINP